MRKMSYYSPTEAESVNKPFGAFKNETSAGMQDGTQAVAEHMQDLYYSLYQVFQLAGVDPNNILEDGNTNKQFLSALGNIAPVLYADTSTYNKNSIVINIQNDIIYFYKSLVSDNTAALSDSSSWLEILHINTNGTVEFVQGVVDENLNNVIKRIDGTYEGLDLTQVHADEIQNDYNGDAWAWIQARIRAVNFEGIHIGDYIPVTLRGGTIGGTYTITANQQHKMQVAGIDTYYNSGDEPIPHHIDFISLETLETNFIWNEGNTNNGTSSEQNPYRSSRLFAILNGVNNYSTSAQGNLKHGLNCASGGILQMLPSNCQSVLIEKRMWYELQYNSSAQTVQPTGNQWGSYGKLWLPHEVEICGYQPNSYNRGEAGNIDNLTRNLSKMYPLFRQQTRVKTGADTHGRSNYWLCCPSGLAASFVCCVAGDGAMADTAATTTNRSACFGFRVA